MLRGLSISAKAAPDLASTVADVLQSCSRALIITTSGVCVAWYVLASLTGWEMAGLSSTFLVSLVVIATAVVALHLLPTNLGRAQLLWLVGLGAALLLAVFLFREPEIVYLMALLPLMAVVMLGWAAGLLAEGLVAVALWWLSRTLLAGAITMSHSLGILAAGAVVGLLGWSVIRSLLSVTEWALSTYEQGQRHVEAMRSQRLELKQVQEDLVLANQELARLSDRLKVMYRVAEEARQAKEDFVANVSHELRTPLNMIIGFSELITQLPEVYSDQLPPMLLADIAAIQRNSQHLSRLVDDVLDLSQIEAGRMALKKERATLPEIVESAVTAVQAFFQSKGLYLRVEVAPDLPTLYCDTTRVRQVLLNLLGNAGRFTEQGGVTIRAWLDKNEVLTSVTDTGPGITLQDQERLFQPFQQLDSSLHRRHGGSGLGLSISKRFVEMHGGRMWMESAAGEGTTFYFSLPLDAPPPAGLSQAGDARRWFSPYTDYRYQMRTRPSKAPMPVARPRFVVLEKGEALQRLLSRYLHGAETVPVCNAEEAVRELERSPAQALVANVSPLEDEWVEVRQLGGLPYNTPLLTCWVPGEDEAARQLGVMRYLVKPVTRDGLLSALDGLGCPVRRILLVDDNQEAVRLFSRMLASAEHRYHVLRATSGRRALNLLREEKPDVMLLDLIMPGMDGFQVLREKAQDPDVREIPVIVLSSRDPGGEPILGDTLSVTRSGGLSARELLVCIGAVSEILSPSEPSAGRAQPETPAG